MVAIEVLEYQHQKDGLIFYFIIIVDEILCNNIQQTKVDNHFIKVGNIYEPLI